MLTVTSQRRYADKKADANVIPPTETKTSERAPASTIDDVGETKAAVTNSEIPLTPPNPKAVQDKKPNPTASIDDVGESKILDSKIPQDQLTPKSSPPPPPPPKKGFIRRLRNFVFTLMVLGAVGFAGGVWYSRINDTFHDYFTEYVPFGEQAVLYLEENEFKKRFPNTKASKNRDTGDQIRIPAQSGASWRVADAGEPSGRTSSAAPTNKRPASKTPDEKKETQAGQGHGATHSKEAEKAISTNQKPKEEVKPQPQPKAETPSKSSDYKTPEVNEPSKFPPLEPIDLLKLSDAREPVVQDLVHMLNDLILVINADGAHGKYGSTIDKAKNDVKKVGGKLKEMRDKVERQSAQEVREKITEFDKAATELVTRVEKAMLNQEMEWRQEFESEMNKVRGSYDERVKLLMEREQKLNEEKLQNQLLEQAVALKQEFIGEVKERVEKEREGRLGQLDALSSAVSDLEKLSVGWNDVVDSNLKTQQLHVAVEAVRAKLDKASHPQPFIKELVALKEIANDNNAVNAAIASVNPSAYQRGIFTSSQLIDRFRRVASEVRKASLLPADAGVASHASSWVLSHVMFKKEGLAEGNDVESILTRTQTFLEEGDLDNAAREMNGLDGWAKTLSKDWLVEVRKVLEVQQALEVSSPCPVI